jgi:hypothetical protein
MLIWDIGDSCSKIDLRRFVEQLKGRRCPVFIFFTPRATRKAVN